MLKRGKINARKTDVRKAVGEVTLELVLGAPAQASLEHVLAELLKVIPSDDSGATVSISKLREDYEAMAAASALAAKAAEAAAAAAAAAAPAGGAGVVLTRKTAAELGTVKADVALAAVRAADGAFNWFLCDAAFNFVNAGSLSAPEMAKWLKEDAVLFGLLRMSFGAGRFKRTKWISLYWPGPKVGMVARAKATGARSGIKAKLGVTSVDIEATGLEDVALDIIIEKVKRSTAVDGATEAGDDPYSVRRQQRLRTNAARKPAPVARTPAVTAPARLPLRARSRSRSPPAGRKVYEGAGGGGARVQGPLWRQGPGHGRAGGQARQDGGADD